MHVTGEGDREFFYRNCILNEGRLGCGADEPYGIGSPMIPSVVFIANGGSSSAPDRIHQRENDGDGENRVEQPRNPTMTPTLAKDGVPEIQELPITG